ncbi:unnamed protein product [Rodentolepis nana]|uniref:F-box/kelch-repeat protein n=1 Tax=Rodentolepis nana TaxID=102285 RepID=A0A0R3TZ52_RODNA|nr:unnamed protein product [Rodentolepis nana]
MIENRSSFSAVARDHAVIVFGGYISQSGEISGSCEEFSPATSTWRKLPPMPTPRYGTGAAHIPGLGDIVVGGTTSTGNCNEAEIFLTTSSPLGLASSWCEIAPMLHSRSYPAAEFFNGNVYVARGSMEMLSFFTEGPPQWTEVLKPTLKLNSLISFNGSLLFGGESCSLLFNIF